MARQGKVTGHGIPAASEGAGPGPQLGVGSGRTREPQLREAAGQLQPQPAEPLGVETRRPHMTVYTFERPMWLLPHNSGAHVELLPPKPPQGSQTPTQVYPRRPIVRRPPGSWDEPLHQEGGPRERGPAASTIPPPGSA